MSPPETTAIPEPPPRHDDAPVRGAGFVTGLITAQFGVYLTVFTPIAVALSARVAQIAPESKTSSLSTVLAVGAVLALIGNPVFGALSDRTATRFGRRRPWIAGGMLGALAGLAVAGTADGIGQLTAGWAVTQLGVNAALAALTATVADRIPERQRARISGALGMLPNLSILTGAVLARFLMDRPLLLFLVPGLVGAASVTLLLSKMGDDRPADPRTLQPFAAGRFLAAFWVSPRRYPDFAWNALGRFLTACAMNAVTGYQFYFITDTLGQSEDQAASTLALSTVAMTLTVVVGALGGGYLSDRTGRRKIFVAASCVVTAVGLALVASAHSSAALYGASLVFGLGVGAYMAVDMALAIAVLPDPANAAKDMGILNVAQALPQSLIPVAAPLLLSINSDTHTNYGALYFAGALCAVAGAFAIRFVRSTR